MCIETKSEFINHYFLRFCGSRTPRRTIFLSLPLSVFSYTLFAPVWLPTRALYFSIVNTLPQYLVTISDPNWKPANIADSSPALDGAEKVHISCELHDKPFGLESIVMEEWCSRDIADPNYLLYLDGSCVSNRHNAFRNPKCLSSKSPAKAQQKPSKSPTADDKTNIKQTNTEKPKIPGSVKLGRLENSPSFTNRIHNWSSRCQEIEEKSTPRISKSKK